jgi:hypothetical protein
MECEAKPEEDLVSKVIYSMGRKERSAPHSPDLRADSAGRLGRRSPR